MAARAVAGGADARALAAQPVDRGGDVLVELGGGDRGGVRVPALLAGVVELEHDARGLDAVVDLGDRDQEAVAGQPHRPAQAGLGQLEDVGVEDDAGVRAGRGRLGHEGPHRPLAHRHVDVFTCEDHGAHPATLESPQSARSAPTRSFRSHAERAQPRHRRDDRRGPSLHARGGRPRRRRRARRVRGLVDHDAGRALARPAEDRRRRRGALGRAGRARGPQRRQAGARHEGRRDARVRGQPALLRRRRTLPARARPRASTSRATRPSPAARRSASSRRSRLGTTP